MIPSTLFDLQRWEPQDETVTSVDGQKRDASFFLTVPEFIDSADQQPNETIRKALSVLAKAQISFRPNIIIHRDQEVISLTSTCDVVSVSSASTSYTRDEESDMEPDQENEDCITCLPPDTLFIVQGKDFPCHANLLSKEALPLLDILSRDGVLERKTKKRRGSSSSQDQALGEQSQAQSQAWSSPSGITVVRLPNDVDSDFFQVLMEFLYTKEIRLKLPEGYLEDDEEDDPWLMDKEDVFEDDQDDENVGHLLDLSSSLDEDATASAAPLKFLQGAFLLADRFGCTSLKNAIENKIYDEFLFSFTAKELFIWADQNKCVCLKQKAMDKLPEPSPEK
jgi:hypothetical protein